MFLSKISGLALILILVTHQLHAMEEGPIEEPQKTGKKRNIDDDSLIGAGHQGSVYRGSPFKGSPDKPAKRAKISDYLMKDSAIKKVSLKEALSQRNIRNALKEASKNYRRIPEVANLSDFDLQDTSVLVDLKMELFYGDRLDNAMNFLSATKFIELMINISNFIAELHALGYAHEDINPANIIINPAALELFGILDFELSGLIGKDQRRMSGQEYFSAPEMRCKGLIAPAADVYSLGKILNKYVCDRNLNNQSFIELINDMTVEKPEGRIGLCEAIERLKNILENENLNALTYYTWSEQEISDRQVSSYQSIPLVDNF